VVEVGLSSHGKAQAIGVLRRGFMIATADEVKARIRVITISM
jgi:hypothetical protein